MQIQRLNLGQIEHLNITPIIGFILHSLHLIIITINYEFLWAGRPKENLEISFTSNMPSSDLFKQSFYFNNYSHKNLLQNLNFWIWLLILVHLNNSCIYDKSEKLLIFYYWSKNNHFNRIYYLKSMFRKCQF